MVSDPIFVGSLVLVGRLGHIWLKVAVDACVCESASLMTIAVLLNYSVGR
jgi:hypothetical protein